MSGFAPIALFVYNRPEHTLRCLEALSANRLAADSILHVFSDGPKQDAKSSETSAIEKVRSIIMSKKWCKEVHCHFAETNKGLFSSIVEGISYVLKDSDRVIVVEDDILTSPGFLEYCNWSLEKYQHEPTVWLVSGYMFPLNDRPTLPPYFFLPTLSCWGWATWKHAWNRFNPDAGQLLESIDKLGARHEFDLHASYPYYNMLQERAQGKNQSWDICWYASFFLGKGLCLYPGTTLAENIGMDGSGTHWIGHGFEIRTTNDQEIDAKYLPSVIASDSKIQHQLEKTLRQAYYPTFIDRISRKLKRLLING